MKAERQKKPRASQGSLVCAAIVAALGLTGCARRPEDMTPDASTGTVWTVPASFTPRDRQVADLHERARSVSRSPRRKRPNTKQRISP